MIGGAEENWSQALNGFEEVSGQILWAMRGFPRFSMTAKEIMEKDKGGLLFSPVVGLHENAAELDFESMFPNIIIRYNNSWYTKKSDGLGGFDANL